ncbi:MAG: cytochrome c oxidase assembly protein [Gammaproteobacteria bacterium]
MATRAEQQQANRSTVTRLLVLTCIMFGFGYALVPLYDVFCEITGLNGKTGRLTQSQAQELAVDETRTVTIEFVTNVSADLPWDFTPTVGKVEVHPGAETVVDFEATNHAQWAVIGNAVPSVSPNAAARYFSKTECFCFTQQSLAAGETRTMPVRFVVDPRLPADITVLTLGYTFFESMDQTAARPATGTIPAG